MPRHQVSYTPGSFACVGLQLPLAFTVMTSGVSAPATTPQDVAACLGHPLLDRLCQLCVRVCVCVPLCRPGVD
jgi:hypothetical protein